MYSTLISLTKMLKTLVWFVTCAHVFCSDFPQTKLFQLWRDFPFKLLMNETVVSPQCQKAYNTVWKQAENSDLDALKMLDATAKLPSGILSGNVNQYGDFDECMGVKTAQYCLVEADLWPADWELYTQYKHLVHSHYFIKDKFSDPAHRIPGFSTFRWGLCLPQECSTDDVEKSSNTNFGFDVYIRPQMCQKSHKNETITVGHYIAWSFFACVFFAVGASSFVDCLSNRSNISEESGFSQSLLMSFSVKRNIGRLLEVKENSNDIACLHGIRALNAFALLMCHKAMSLFFNPYMNRTQAVESLAKPWTIVAKNAIIYTDVFILISGLLNAHTLFKDLHNCHSMKFKDKLINRLFRLLPNVIALILFCTYILPNLGSGPLWPTIIDHHSALCKQYMWRNLFFVHNYFGFDNMCLTHTHQIGIDMQLFLITPPLTYLIWKHSKIGLSLLFSLGLISTILRFWVSYSHELATVIFFGMPVSKMFSVASLSYILPTHRASIYFIGVYLAYFLKYLKPPTRPSKINLTFLWCFFLTCFFVSWLGPYHMVKLDYTQNNLETALISAFYPITWGAGVAFGIYITNEQFAGWLGDIFTWKYFQVFTKIAYAVYLVQFPVFFYNVGLTRHVAEYHSGLLVFETGQILSISTILVIIIEMPFQNIKRVLFDGTNVQVKTAGQSVTRKSKTG